MKVIIGLVLALLFIIPGILNAADAAFQRADTNNDGKVDEKELEAAVVDRFKKYDKNADGVLSKKEFNPKNDPRVQREFKFMDRDASRNVSIDEFKAAAFQRFNTFDENRDNALDQPEYRSNKAYPILKFYF